MKLRSGAANERTISRKALTHSRKATAQLWKQASRGNPSERAGLGQPRRSRLERLIAGHCAIFVLIELRIIEESPPRTFGDRVSWSSLLPRRRSLPVLG